MILHVRYTTNRLVHCTKLPMGRYNPFIPWKNLPYTPASSVVFTGLPQAFRAFSIRYPEVELELREMHSGAQLAALRAGTIDVALLRESPARACEPPVPAELTSSCKPPAAPASASAWRRHPRKAPASPA